MLPASSLYVSELLGLQTSGFYVPESMSIVVGGLSSPSLSQDHVLNGTFLHEYLHHLHFCATTAGLAYHLSSLATTQALLELASAFRERRRDALIPRSADTLLAQAKGDRHLDKQVARYAFEVKYRNNMLGWPCAPLMRRTCPPVGLILEDGSKRVLPVGLLLICENHARLQQWRYLRVNVKDEAIIDNIDIRTFMPSEETFIANYCRYLSIADGFVQNFGYDPQESETLFLWACAKALMPPPMLYPEDLDDAENAAANMASATKIDPRFPGQRYFYVSRFLLNFSDRRFLLNLCQKGQFEELDALVSSALGWAPIIQVVDQLEGQAEKPASTLMRKIIRGAVACHRKYPDFLVWPVAHIFGLLNELPLVSTILPDGSLRISDWCSLPERYEIAHWSVSRELAIALERPCPMRCYYSKCCAGYPANTWDRLGRRSDTGNCHLEINIQKHWGLSLRDFELAHSI